MKLGIFHSITCFVTYFFLLDNIDEAYALIKDLEPSSPQEYILKAVANTIIGQEHGAVSHPFKRNCTYIAASDHSLVHFIA